MADPKQQLGKLGHLFSDIFGSAIGTIISKPIEDAIFPSVLKDRNKQLLTMVFGPKEEDERKYNEALVILQQRKKEKFPGFLTNLLARLTKPGEMDTELQDMFRQMTIQENAEKTADVLEIIESMTDDAWADYRKFFNLNRASLPFDSEKECRTLEKRLSDLKSRPKKLSWAQRFNFLSMTAPSNQE